MQGSGTSTNNPPCKNRYWWARAQASVTQGSRPALVRLPVCVAPCPRPRAAAHRPRQLLHGTRLLDEAARARLERIEQLLFLRQPRQDKHLRPDTERDDPARGLETALSGHCQIHQDDVRPGRRGAGHGFVPRASLADHGKIGSLLQEFAHPGSEDDVVVRQQDADGVPGMGERVEVDRYAPRAGVRAARPTTRAHIRPCKTRAPRDGAAVAAVAPPGLRVGDAPTRQSVARSLQFARGIRTCVPCSSTPHAARSPPPRPISRSVA